MAKYVLSSNICNMINAVSGYIETSAADGDYITAGNTVLSGCSFTFRPNGKPYMNAICPEGNTASDGSYVVVDDGTNTHAISLIIDSSGITIDPPQAHAQPSNWFSFDAVNGGGIRVDVLSTDTAAEIANKVVAEVSVAGGIPNTAVFIENNADSTAVVFVNVASSSVGVIYRCDVDGLEDSGSFGCMALHNGDGDGTQYTDAVPTGLDSDSTPALKRSGDALVIEPDANRQSYFSFDGVPYGGFLLFTNDSLARPLVRLVDISNSIQEYSSPLLASSIVATLEAAAVEPTNLVLVGDKAVGEVAVDPTVDEVLVGGNPLPTGSILRNTQGTPADRSDDQKFIKKAVGGSKAYVAIPIEPKAEWKLATGSGSAWAILQGK